MERGGSSRGYGVDLGVEGQTDREAAVVDIPVEDEEESGQKDKVAHCLVGKLISPKSPNAFHLLEIMRKSWKTKCEFSAREWRKNLFLFSFVTEKDRDWVLQRQPWHFDGNLFAIAALDGSAQPSSIRLDRGSFWVRVYDLPMKCLKQSILKHIAQQIGKVEEIDMDANYGGCFARMKINLDITAPLLRGLTIAVEGKKLWAPIKYENLPIFCWRCGTIGHHTRACDKESEDDDNGKQFEDLLYGPMLKASPLKRLRSSRQAESFPLHNANDCNPTHLLHPQHNTHQYHPPHTSSHNPRPPPFSLNLDNHQQPLTHRATDAYSLPHSGPHRHPSLTPQNLPLENLASHLLSVVKPLNPNPAAHTSNTFISCPASLDGHFGTVSSASTDTAPFTPTADLLKSLHITPSSLPPINTWSQNNLISTRKPSTQDHITIITKLSTQPPNPTYSLAPNSHNTFTPFSSSSSSTRASSSLPTKPSPNSSSSNAQTNLAPTPNSTANLTPKHKKWTRLARQPKSDNPLPKLSDKKSNKRHFSKEGSVVCPEKIEAVESVLKRLKGPPDEDSSLSFALSAAIATTQSRRAQ